MRLPRILFSAMLCIASATGLIAEGVELPREPGVTFDDSALVSSGWVRATSESVFPAITEENKFGALLAGYQHRQHRAQIFLLYQINDFPLPMSEVSPRPSKSLLEFLKADGDGERRPGFIKEGANIAAPGLDAVTWKLKSKRGSGLSFLPKGGGKLPTFGVRTVLSFAVREPEARQHSGEWHVVVNAFLRCEDRDLVRQQLLEDFDAYLQTLAPTRSSIMIYSEELLQEVAQNFQGGLLFDTVEDLVERHLVELNTDRPIQLSEAEREAVSSFLSFFPEDYFANKLARLSRPHRELPEVGDTARDNYQAYVEACLTQAVRLEDPAPATEYYGALLRELDPNNTAFQPPPACTAGEQWKSQLADEILKCQELQLALPDGVATVEAWVREDSGPGSTVNYQGASYTKWNGLQVWLPVDPDSGAMVEIENGKPALHWVQDASAQNGTWIQLRRILTMAEASKNRSNVATLNATCQDSGMRLLKSVQVAELKEELKDLATGGFLQKEAGNIVQWLAIADGTKTLAVSLFMESQSPIDLTSKKDLKPFRDSRELLAVMCSVSTEGRE